MKKLIKITKSKKFPHVVGNEYEERCLLDRYTENFIKDKINIILNHYLYENESEFDESLLLENLEVGCYYVECLEFNYTIEILPSELKARADEYDEFYDFQLKAFDTAYEFYNDESLVSIENTSTNSFNGASTENIYALVNKNDKAIGFVKIIKHKDYYEYEIS